MLDNLSRTCAMGFTAPLYDNIALGKIICIWKLKHANFKWKTETTLCSCLQALTPSLALRRKKKYCQFQGATQGVSERQRKLMAPPGGAPENRIMIKRQLNTLRTCELPSAGATLEILLSRLRLELMSLFITLNATFLRKCLRATSLEVNSC